MLRRSNNKVADQTRKLEEFHHHFVVKLIHILRLQVLELKTRGRAEKTASPSKRPASPSSSTVLKLTLVIWMKYSLNSRSNF